MPCVRTVVRRPSQVQQANRTGDSILANRLLTVLRRIVAYAPMQNDAPNCIIVRTPTQVDPVHHRQVSPTSAQVQSESDLRPRCLHALDQPNRVPLHLHHAQEYRRLQVGSRQVQVAVTMRIRRIVLAIARVTQNAHQDADKDSIGRSFDPIMPTWFVR